jgi:two-component system cell cycle sensor histidine kinase/response regulator CckA
MALESSEQMVRDDVSGGGNGNSKLRRLSNLFELLGPDCDQNLHTIVQQACDLINAACALYHRLDDRTITLVCWAGYRLGAEFPPREISEGHICYEAVINSGSRPIVFEDLSKTSFQRSDPWIERYGVKSYLGYPVVCGEGAIGSLCILDTRIRTFNDTDIHILATLAKALSLEEKRKQAEEALRRSEKKHRQLYKMLRLLTDNVPDLIWAKDLGGRYMFANQAVCDNLLRCNRPDDVIGKKDRDFDSMENILGQTPSFGEMGLGTDAIVARTRSNERFLAEGRVHDRHLILDVHKAPFWDENGNMIGMVGCGRDVTKEKQIERALQQSEKRYRNLYCNTPVMLFSADTEDRMVSVSNYWLESMGFQRDEVVGRSMFDFIAPNFRREAAEKAFPRFYKTGKLTSYPFHYLTKSGQVKKVLLSMLAERDAAGNYAGAMGYVVDLTDVTRAEEENKRLSARLQQAQKMESIATLAGGIAHQFNNSLAVILGNLELIQMDGLPDQNLARFIAPIDASSHKMVQLTSELLAFAREGKFQTQTLPAHTLVKEALQLVSHSVASTVELETDLDETTDHIEVDRSQIQMLLTAILANAAEAIEGNGRIRISLDNFTVTERECLGHPGLRPGKMVRLRITDTGNGMDEETRARIFEPFFTTKFTGRGLGMAAVYGIVKKHNGYIYVDSNLNQGSTVTIYLPRTKPAPPVHEEAPLVTATQTGTALIIEDEEMVMDVSRAILKKLGYHTLEARSGQEAVELVNTYRGRIDFALLDIILPDQNGNQIYPLLMKARPNLKVIVCSGFTQDGPAEEILEAGADSFIQKPFSAATISAAIKAVFKDDARSKPSGE